MCVLAFNTGWLLLFPSSQPLFTQFTCFLFNFARGNKKLCMLGVNVVSHLTRFFFFHLHWILKTKLFFSHLSIRSCWSPRFWMLRWGEQVHKEGKRGRYGHRVKVWTTDDDLLALKAPRRHIGSFRSEGGVEIVGWLRVLTVMEILMCGIELWYWEFNTSMAPFPLSNYIL